MLNVRQFGPGWRVVLASAGGTPENAKERWGAEVISEVESQWLQAKAERGDGLFNGGILSLDKIEGDSLICVATEYKFFLAQRRNPILLPCLNIRCLAVSGLLECRDGFVLGRRSTKGMTQDAGCWEFVPSGGIEPGEIGAGGLNIDFIAQLKAELWEETGIDWRYVAESHPVLLVEDDKNQVVDIVVRLSCPGLSSEQVLDFHESLASREYTQLVVVKTEELSKSQEHSAQGEYRLSELSALLLHSLTESN